jgi:hypothetical protein
LHRAAIMTRRPRRRAGTGPHPHPRVASRKLAASAPCTCPTLEHRGGPTLGNVCYIAAQNFGNKDHSLRVGCHIVIISTWPFDTGSLTDILWPFLVFIGTLCILATATIVVTLSLFSKF